MTAPTAAALTELVESPLNPRRTYVKPRLEEMAASIRTLKAGGHPYGIIEPLLVRHYPRQMGTDAKWEIIAGTRRFRAAKIAGLTEVRVGTYIYQDRATVAAGAAELDECALHVHATVISRPTPDRAVIDAGSKSLSSDRVDPAAGHVVLTPPPGVANATRMDLIPIDAALEACRRQLAGGVPALR